MQNTNMYIVVSMNSGKVVSRATAFNKQEVIEMGYFEDYFIFTESEADEFFESNSCSRWAATNVKYMVCSHHKKLQIKTNVELAIHYIYCCMPLILIK